ncbi:periplasmic chaperone for outer membrane proteins Skp [Neolewinella xylanilytica]|uniref:Periplasmic chaperone for outer membrane proteins Skp n=1 Tax=Neolewinella xylanilytica TaxID=1514080 RepID=A0A2S6IAR5_9BACT|nr:OmpH family outer membrane protein [Neolewinella xylanilytica]PPK88549.1 periplasmic chaperone for outer membrane proteins Skp [Neolewinella xylanilytica]
MRQLFLVLFLSISAFAPLTAQQYGHLNFANLLSEMPGTKAAETELQTYNQQLVEQGEKMVADLRARVEEVQAQAEDLPPVRLEELRAELSQQRDEIATFEQQVQMNLEQKRQELLGPLIQEARDAITAVAEENGYVMIFDTSQFNTVLFAEDSDDIMALVKAKLGI